GTRWFAKLNNHACYRLRLLRLEDRLAPATASLASGVLTINYTATGTTAEAVTLTNNGTNIALTGNISGTTNPTTASVTKIVVTASGNSNNQSITMAGTASYTLSGGLSF